HASTYEGKDVPKGAPAAGWFVPEVRNGELWATQVRWTPPGASNLKKREYRYISPTFAAPEGRVTRLVSVALTNTPALDNPEPLVAASDKPRKDSAMTPEELKTTLAEYLKEHLRPLHEKFDAMSQKHDVLDKKIDKNHTDMSTRMDDVEKKCK